jgi:hypothetical protein
MFLQLKRKECCTCHQGQLGMLLQGKRVVHVIKDNRAIQMKGKEGLKLHLSQLGNWNAPTTKGEIVLYNVHVIKTQK